MPGYRFLILVLLITIGAAAGWLLRRRLGLQRAEDADRAARRVVALFAVIDLVLVLSLIPELLTYPVSAHRLVHAPALARALAAVAAPLCVGLAVPLAIPLLRGPARSVRLRAALSVLLALMPLPLHALVLRLVSALFDVHFFWR
jgi:hypothetical protein